MGKGDPGFLDHLIDRHIALLEIRRKLGEESRAGGRSGLSSKQGPWLTISKELGSGGEEIGRLVAERLGWHLFDREILEAIARTTRTRERLLSRLDERAVSRLDEFFANVLMPGVPSQEAFLNEMMQVIWMLGRDGHAVLLGRGANWILDASYGLRVRLTSPVEERVDRVARQGGTSHLDAQKQVHRDDTRRAGFIRQVYDRDIADPLGYDLTLNTAALGTDACERIIVAALRDKLGIKTPA
ncbi:MAG TPA: cytidylate kinase-like family protein [Candidatus Polarisedimenticolia bacterium]|nr:cytidylate kinase-like family protein [Candidatus Polarisedimenticolia bacterium]